MAASGRPSDLFLLTSELRRDHHPRSVRWAAVWLVMENGGLDDLLEGGRHTGVDLSVAARALRVCARAGIDVRRLRVWRDAERLACTHRHHLDGCASTPQCDPR